MKRILTVTLALFATTLVFGQDRPKDRIEVPIKKALAPAPDRGTYDLSKTGIEWHKGIDKVVDRGKPILLFQLLGDFDDLLC